VIRVAHNGRQIDTMVLLPRAASCIADAFQGAADTSKFLLAPMPGLLASVAVQPGQVVAAGDRLAVVEAMKMKTHCTRRGTERSRKFLAQSARAWRSINHPAFA